MSHCILTMAPSGCWYDLPDTGDFPIDFEVSEGLWPSVKATSVRMWLSEKLAEEMILALSEALDCYRARPKD